MNLKEAQAELQRHGFDTFVDEPPSIAEGGNGIVTPGCPACRKKLQTNEPVRDSLFARTRLVWRE